jgi:hypothetical protein
MEDPEIMNWEMDLLRFIRADFGYDQELWLSLLNRISEEEQVKLIMSTILYTRDIKQVGDNYAAYDMIYWFSRTYVKETKEMLNHMFEHRIGCWKDVKYIAEHVRVRNGYRDWLIDYIVSLMVNQLKRDQRNLRINIPEVSNAGKWCPREKTKYNWIFNKVAKQMYPPESYSKVSKMRSRKILRHLLADINKTIHTLEVKMCARDNKAIYQQDISKYSFDKYRKFFGRNPDTPNAYRVYTDMNATTIKTTKSMFDKLIRPRYMF